MPVADTGVAEIDIEIRYAREMLRRVRNLREQVESRIARDGNPALLPACARKLGDLLSRLLNFLYQHCVDEEELMHFCGFHARHPKLYAIHVEDHADITQQLAALIGNNIDIPTVTLLHQVEAFVEAWCTDHIPGHDLVFARTLQ
jgi:hypothetical protein